MQAHGVSLAAAGCFRCVQGLTLLHTCTCTHAHAHAMTKVTTSSCETQVHPRSSSLSLCWRCTGRQRVALQVCCGVPCISSSITFASTSSCTPQRSLGDTGDVGQQHRPAPCARSEKTAAGRSVGIRGSLLAVMCAPAVGLGNGGFCSAYTQKGFHAANHLVGLCDACLSFVAGSDAAAWSAAQLLVLMRTLWC